MNSAKDLTHACTHRLTLVVFFYCFAMGVFRCASGGNNGLSCLMVKGALRIMSAVGLVLNVLALN